MQNDTKLDVKSFDCIYCKFCSICHVKASDIKDVDAS